MLRRNVKFLFLIVASAILASLSVVSLVLSLNWITQFHLENHNLIYGIPLVTILTVYTYKKFIKDNKSGVPRLFDEIHSPLLFFPKRIAPLTFVFTSLSHLVGSSVGREGAALIVGVSFSDRLAAFFRLEHNRRDLFLMAMLAASFSCALNSPLAGMFFSFESTGKVKKIFNFKSLYILIASIIGFYIRSHLAILNDEVVPMSMVNYDLKLIIALLFFGLIAGLFSRTFVFLLDYLEKYFHNLISHRYLRSLIFSFILVGLFHFSYFDMARGLGFNYIDSFLTGEPISSHIFVTKFVATIISILSEMKGGEFVPMVYMGAALGNMYGNWLNLSPILFTMVGYVAIFAGASHAPIAMSFVSLSLFGVNAFIPSLVVCMMANLFSGRVSVYKQFSNSKIKF